MIKLRAYIFSFIFIAWSPYSDMFAGVSHFLYCLSRGTARSAFNKVYKNCYLTDLLNGLKDISILNIEFLVW